MPKSFLPRKSHKTDGSDCETDEGAGEERVDTGVMKLQKDLKNPDPPLEHASLKGINGVVAIDHCSEVNETDPGPSLDVTARLGELIDHPYMSTDQDQDKKLRNKTKDKVDKIKSYTCVFCYKTFSQQYILNRHLPVHTDDRKYGCTVCGKTFRQASTLCRHKVIHTNEKRFACKSCDKSFNRVSTLIAHEKIHVGDKAYVCPTCGKGFHQKGNLKNHIFTHTGEKPYVCKVESCGKSFNQLSNLSVHMAMKHKEKVRGISDKGVKSLAEVKADKVACETLCNICYISFDTKAELKAHTEDKHSILKHVVPPSGEVANNHEKMDAEGKKLIVASSVGRSVNDPHCRTITLPNGDKTIMPSKQKQNKKGLDCWYDMDDNVRAAASILMELESSAGNQVQSKAGEDTVIVEHVAIEQPEPTCSQNKTEVRLVETGTNTVETGAGQTATVTNLSTALPVGLHKIGATDDGQILALLVKADGTYSLVTVSEIVPTPHDSQAPEILTSSLVPPAVTGTVEVAEISLAHSSSITN